MQYTDASAEEIKQALQQAWNSFHEYRKLSLLQRKDFLYAIADALAADADMLAGISGKETNLPEVRLRSEINRTIFQLKSYADFTAAGGWLDVRIDTADLQRNPPKPDIRKMMVPLGPVAVFGASNFPFAYSTAGGDTASALAAGCPVIVKAHPAHPETSERVAACIRKAMEQCKIPSGVFTHIHGSSFEVGRQIVQDPNVKAVGFTGSLQGGRALFDWAAQRPDPIPVFSEMGSVNPVYLFPGRLAEAAESIAKEYAASITVGVGQFCTNPGILIGISGPALNDFKKHLQAAVSAFPGGKMLHAGIDKAYREKRKTALAQKGVEQLVAPGEQEGSAAIAVSSGRNFLSNTTLHQEVFGPYSILIECSDFNEMKEVTRQMEGQLTTSVIALPAEIQEHDDLLQWISNNCGRIVFNGVPTGVEVCLAMQHGGPYPSCTDSRFTSVGADAIRRFVRPLAFQNCPDELLPPELRNANPLGLLRTINNQPTRDSA